MLQSRGFSAPKALLQKPLEATFSSTHPIERTLIIRASSIYTFHEQRAQCADKFQKNAILGKKRFLLSISIKTSGLGFLTIKLQNTYSCMKMQVGSFRECKDAPIRKLQPET